MQGAHTYLHTYIQLIMYNKLLSRHVGVTLASFLINDVTTTYLLTRVTLPHRLAASSVIFCVPGLDR